MDTARSTLSPEAFGWIASSLTLLTFMCADMRRLRCAALGANAAFIAYSAVMQLWPVLVLNVLLVPVKLWRLAQVFRAESQADVPSRRVTRPRRPTRTVGVAEPPDALQARTPKAPH